ncbi:MAG: 4'-phosphopantetheinyl transferase superfamily protein [Gemmatimonadota bacterium]|jgi:4'-phosphopantetheinyl transferase|nr:4'-phosphopantetheinyl transferase superfamily protein [Gemmatimonadota bacterium]
MDEADRYSRIRFPEDRARALVARGMLRTILAAQSGIPPAGLAFHYSPKGKPTLAPVHKINLPFSVSHSGDWALIGVGGAGRVGVDIERLRPFRKLSAIADRYFAPREITLLHQVDEASRLRTFFSLWTAKEAFVKALGGGISHGFHTFTVLTDNQGQPAVSDVDGSEAEGARWTIWSGEPTPGYLASVAIDLPAARVVPHIWTGSDGEQPWCLQGSNPARSVDKR